MLHWSVCK